MLRRPPGLRVGASVAALVSIIAFGLLRGPSPAVAPIDAGRSAPVVRTSADAVGEHGDHDVALPRHRASADQDRVHLLGLALVAVVIVVTARRLGRDASGRVAVPRRRSAASSRAPPAPTLA